MGIENVEQKLVKYLHNQYVMKTVSIHTLG